VQSWRMVHPGRRRRLNERRRLAVARCGMPQCLPDLRLGSDL